MRTMGPLAAPIARFLAARPAKPDRLAGTVRVPSFAPRAPRPGPCATRTATLTAAMLAAVLLGGCTGGGTDVETLPAADLHDGSLR